MRACDVQGVSQVLAARWLTRAGAVKVGRHVSVEARAGVSRPRLEGGEHVGILGAERWGVACCDQRRFLNRQLSLPVSTMSQWCVRRSSSAVVIFGSPNTAAHSAKARLVVTMIDVRS
jgi:hypothetical protein